MKDDPIVEEVRKVRDRYAKQFNYDAERIVQDLNARAKAHSSRVVSFASKSVSLKNSA